MQGSDYYRLLARALPASELGSALYRRLRAGTRRRLAELAPIADPARRLDVVAALRLSCVDDFAGRMRTPRAARGPIEPGERLEARRLLREEFPSHALDVVARAQHVLDGRLHLFGQWRDHSRGDLAPGVAAIDWTRDPLHGGCAADRPSREIDPNVRGFDARAIWEAGRFAHVAWLAQAAVVADQEVATLCARAAVLHVRDFLATQPVGRGIHWTCPMEAALRVIHLSSALMLLRDSSELDAQFWVEAAESLWQHARFIEAGLEDSQTVPGNHLLSDFAGLATVGCLFPELPGALAWRRRGLDGFETELIRQTTPDGLSFESSLPYHRFVTELGLFVQALARRQGLSLCAPALRLLWRMCDVAQAATLPDGRLANVGDNDASRAFSFELRDPRDSSHLAALRAALGGPGRVPSVEPEALWIGGLQGLRRNRRQQDASAPARVFTASGLAVLREGGRGVSLWAGANGQHGLGGHAHNDKLSCEIVLDGERIVIDPGSPTYMSDPDERDRYRATAVHATVQLDGREQGPIPSGRPFLLPETARAELIEIGDRRVRGEHRGYLALRPGVVHRREVALPAGIRAVCVTDHLLGEGVHVVDLHWPFPHRDVSLRPATLPERALLQTLEGLPCGEGRFDPTRVFVLGDGAGGARRALIACAAEQPFDAELTESTWSPGYGERRCARVAHVRLHAQLPLAVTTIFVSLDPPADAPFDAS